MAQKWQTISELAADTSRKVTHSPEEWCRFLTTAARFYKAYDFDDQLLIYAQKPDATACADMSTWNNKMRRWVNAGSTAIALIRKGTAASLIWTMCMMWQTPIRYGAAKTRGCGN